MYHRILVPIDGSDASEGGMSEALRIAKEAGSILRFFHVVDLTYVARAGEGTTVFADQWADVTRREAAKLLDAARVRASELGIQAESASAEIMAGRAADEIVHEVDRSQSDLIVMGTHGRRGFQRAMLGSDAEWVARRAAVPVLLVPLRVRP